MEIVTKKMLSVRSQIHDALINEIGKLSNSILHTKIVIRYLRAKCTSQLPPICWSVYPQKPQLIPSDTPGKHENTPFRPKSDISRVHSHLFCHADNHANHHANNHVYCQKPPFSCIPGVSLSTNVLHTKTFPCYV